MQNQPQHQPAGMSPGDIYYILFRHKWKIIVLSVAGLVAAGVVASLPNDHASEAKLLIRNVVESGVPSGTVGDPRVKTPDPGGANIMNTESQIIQSLDLASQVVAAVGAETILEGTGETNELSAVSLVRGGLKVLPVPQSDILSITFQHRDGRVAQLVLTQLIDKYLQRHIELRRSIGVFDDFLEKQRADLAVELGKTEEALQKTNSIVGVMPIEEAKKSDGQALFRTREQLFDAQAELAEREAAFVVRTYQLPEAVRTKLLMGVFGTNRTTRGFGTNLLARAIGTNELQNSATPNSKLEAEVPDDKIEEYRSVHVRLDSLRRAEQGMVMQFRDGYPGLRSIRQDIATEQKKQQNLERDYPGLKSQLALSSPGEHTVDFSEDIARITALGAKIDAITNRLDTLTGDAERLNAMEPAVMALQRKKDLQDTRYRHFLTSLEQARFDKALRDVVKNADISVAQSPMPVAVEPKWPAKKWGMLAIGGIGIGIGLALLIEFVLDPSVRRPGEIESRLRLPLFLTIPRMDEKNQRRSLLGWVHRKKHAGALPETSETGAEPATNHEAGLAPYHANGMGPYYEALRDRMVTYFEANNLTHKPKLIAVTACGKGAGATTIATGLAASLSETGDGNVLVVDMSGGKGAAHPFFKGKPGTGLADALTNDKRDGALVQENLYAVAESGNGGGQLPRAWPRRFNSLVPQLKASDYDYIIFDMPPVSQISITPRLAGFMDMVLLVLESEKTDRDVVKRVTTMLAESKANVRAILNKNHSYVPTRLLEEV